MGLKNPDQVLVSCRARARTYDEERAATKRGLREVVETVSNAGDLPGQRKVLMDALKHFVRICAPLLEGSRLPELQGALWGRRMPWQWPARDSLEYGIP